MDETMWSAFESRDDLKKYKDNALLLFALQMKFQIDDITGVASDCLTDQKNDRKCDLIYVDRERKVAVIAQGYFSQNMQKKSAKSNKAATLSTAVGWALSNEVESLPNTIKSASVELRSAIEDGEITSIQCWYVHNLPESSAVEKEMEVVRKIIRQSVDANWPNSNIEVVGLEVGQNILSEWYHGLTVNILVQKELSVDIQGGFEIISDGWKGFVTSVKAKWLWSLYQDYKKNLFSANVRDYLGSRNTESNINNSIKTTVNESPDNFWVYNNGITALVNSYQSTPTSDGTGYELKLDGLSIVNGAQTTGAIGSVDEIPDERALVPIRFIVANNNATIEGIVRYNNSQNEIQAMDLRSNDSVQKRLVKEFKKIPDTDYNGGRRGSGEDVIRRPGNILPSSTVGQSLAAFHGKPVIAYNKKSGIWKEEQLYRTLFHERTSATHIVFCVSAMRAVEAQKDELLTRQKDNSPLSDLETDCLDFFKQRGATKLAVAALGECLETFLGKAVEDPFAISFGAISLENAVEIWKPLVDIVLSFPSTLDKGVSSGFSSDKANSALSELKQLIASTKRSNQKIYSNFSNSIK